jgi:two-component system response regulator MprA
MGLRVLIAEDDPHLRAMVRRGLGYAGFEVFEASDGADALAQALGVQPDLVVLDVGMCRALRASSSVPILMLTARGEISDRVNGLRDGADDYLVKPFAFQELVARLEALARRSGLAFGEVLSFADLRLDTDTGELARDGRRIELKPRERALLELLLRHPGQVIPTTTLWERLWGEDRSGESNALNVALSGLRRNLGEPAVIATVRGIGYRLEAPPQ